MDGIQRHEPDKIFTDDQSDFCSRSTFVSSFEMSSSSSTDAPCTYTLTYSECVENHAGMQCIGEKAERVLSLKEMDVLSVALQKLGCKVELHTLKAELLDEDMQKGVEEAVLLVVRKGADALLAPKRLTASDMLTEQKNLVYLYKGINRQRQEAPGHE